jgi:hypothetical protein
VGKQVDQGTRFESRMVNNAHKAGRAASRLPKTGVKDEPDLQIRGHSVHPAVGVEHWLKIPGQKRRTAIRYVAIPEDVFNLMLALDEEQEMGFLVQAKSRQAINVRKTLEGLMVWMKGGDDNGNRI